VTDFYVGYLPKAPVTIARFVRRAAVALGLLAMMLALVFAMVQLPFANSVFEYGKLHKFEGTIVTKPYPMLLVARPGEVTQEQKYSDYLLVAPGKHGADDLVAGLNGKRVRLQGQLIYRADDTMIEVVPASIAEIEFVPGPEDATRDLGSVTVTGEIVDSKCYLGVMNPGSGKVHRDCAARCLSGGIPPILVMSEGNHLLLVGSDGSPLSHDALREFVAETITIRGDLLQRGEARFLKVDPRELRHTPDRIEAVLGK
jgi:hypothetical protein